MRPIYYPTVKGWAFSHNGTEFRAEHQLGTRNVRLLHHHDGVWELGHSREISDPRKAKDMAALMRRYIAGIIDWDEYNEAEV